MNHQPAVPVKIEKVQPGGLRILWSDGQESTYSFAQLRGACPCAACRELRERPLPLATAAGPEAATPRAIQPVGRYAYAIEWQDGHSSGIYSFGLLRRLAGLGELPEA